jgi:hypothetical protein
MGHIVDSGIGLSYRPAKLKYIGLAGRYTTISFSQRLRIWLLDLRLQFYINMKLCTAKNVGPACISMT